MSRYRPWDANGGVYFGYATDRTTGKPPEFAGQRPVRYVDDRHIITVGPNGSGKSHRLLLPNLVELRDWSMLVVDPKGELALRTMNHRKGDGREIILLNPFDVAGLGSHGFNPLLALDPDSEDFPDDAMGLAEAIIRIEGTDPHWSQSAQDLVCALIMYVRLNLPDPSLADVRAMLGQTSRQLRDMICEHTITYRGRARRPFDIPGVIQTGKLVSEELIAKASRFAELTSESRELNSIISAALTQTRWLDSRPIKRDLSKGAFNFSVMKDKPVTIYLILPARRLMTHSTWLRLMITSVLQSLMKEAENSHVPVLLMLDEFAQLGHLPAIEQNLALMRGYGIKLWAVLQDLSQAEAIYDRRWESFLGNAGVLQSFAPRDVKTAEHLSRLSGITPKSALQATPTESGTDVQISESQFGAPLMLAQDFRNMENGYSILFSHKAKGPIRVYLPYPDRIEHVRIACGMPAPGA